MTKKSSIGLWIDPAWVAAAQLERTRDGVALRASVVLERGSGAGENLSGVEAQRLVGTLGRLGFCGSAVTLGVAEPALVGAPLDIPPVASGAPVERIASGELAKMYRLQPGSFRVGVWDLPAPAASRDRPGVMAVAMPHKEAEASIAPLEEAGLDVAAVDAHPCAAARALSLIVPRGKGEVDCVVDFGSETVRIVVVYEGLVVYTRSARSSGVGVLERSVIESLDLDDDVAWYALYAVGLDASDERWELLGDVREQIRAWSEPIQRETAAALDYARRRHQTECSGRLLASGRPPAGVSALVASSCDTAEIPPALPGADALADPRLVIAVGLAARFDA